MKRLMLILMLILPPALCIAGLPLPPTSMPTPGAIARPVTNRTILVSATQPTQGGVKDPAAAITLANATGGKISIFLNRGENFRIEAMPEIWAADVSIDAYGTGDPPVITLTKSGTILAHKSQRLLVRNIQLAAAAGADVTAIGLNGTDATFENCSAGGGLRNWALVSEGPEYGFGSPAVGVRFSNCSVPHVRWYGYYILPGASNVWIDHCEILGTEDQHCIRIENEAVGLRADGSRGIVGGSSGPVWFTNNVCGASSTLDASGNPLKLVSVLNVRRAGDIYVANNVFRGMAPGFAGAGIGPLRDVPTQRLSGVYLCRNVFIDVVNLELWWGTDGLLAQENLFLRCGTLNVKSAGSKDAPSGAIIGNIGLSISGDTSRLILSGNTKGAP